MTRWMWTSALAVALIAAGCGSGGGDTVGLPGLQSATPAVGNVDVVSSALSVEEADITAFVDAGKIVVTLPVKRLASGTVKGTATLALLDLDNQELAKASQAFTLKDTKGVVQIGLPASALPEPGAPEAGVLVRYELSAGASRAVGYRSLMHVLPKLEVQARVPDRMLVGAGSKVRVFALDPLTSKPVKDMPVSITLTPAADAEAGGGEAGTPPPEPLVLTGTTDEEGTAVLEVPAQEEDGEYEVAVEAGPGSYAMAFASAELAVERSHRVLVTTDKPLYQPGQTMHIRTLALKRPSMEAEAARDMTLEVYDGKGNMVFRKYAKTNDFGIASADFKLATQVNMGHYQVKAHLDGTSTTKTVTVERYSLPPFKVAVSLDRAWYLVGETVEGVVDAGYFFGKAVASGNVTVKATAFDVTTDVFATVTGKTNADGLFPFEITLPDYLVGQPLEGGNGLVALTVEVVDTTGHGEVKELPVVVAEHPVDLVAIPESGTLVPGLENLVYLFATDPLNQPVDAALTVTIGGQTVDVEPLGDGIGRFAVTPTGAVAFTVTAATAAGESASESFTLQPGAAEEGLIVRTQLAIYRVGDTLDAQIFTTGIGGRVFVDVIKDGQTWLTETVPVVDGVGTLSLDLDATLVGDLLLEAYQVSPTAEIQRDKKLVLVRDAGGLNVAVTPEEPVYLPGEEATIHFDVTDAEGTPAVAALGVQIVDEKVYAVSEMKPGLLETYFLVQEALQEPKYEIHGVSFDLAPVLTGDPEDPVAQVTAEASFAAMDKGAAAGELSAQSQLRAKVPGVLGPHFGTQKDRIKTVLAAIVDAQTLDETAFAQALVDQTVFWDAWGNLYTATASSTWQGFEVKLASMGPDELPETWDDWTGTVTLTDPRKGNEWGWDDDFAAGGGPMADAGGVPPGVPTEGNGGGEEGPRVRKDFPETLYFNPALITDEKGQASITLNMADSITEWRISTLANTKAGALGSTTGAVTVFQDFFVDVDFPPTLTRGDAVSFPVALYNYLETPQQVTLTLEPASWYTLAGASSATIDLGPGEVTSVSFPVTVEEVGLHALTVTAIGSQMSDAVQRVVQVVPDGREVRDSASGVLEGTSTYSVTYPPGIIPSSHDLLVKVYPGVMAQAVEGLDSMLQMPSGCFEQTTATNWPNTLVVDYLRKSGQTSPEIELKALDYLQQGYQRLLTYECTGGGFVWFGDPSPANVVLSAMGVLEFSDMAQVIEVDEQVIRRTVTWLEGAQFADGHWHTDQGSEFATVQYDDVKTTAWTAWALAESPFGQDAVDKALAWLTPHAADPAVDVYSLAMMGNAFATAEPDSQVTKDLLNRLADLAVTDDDGTVHWVYEGSGYNYGGPQTSGVNATSIEVTALATSAFIKAQAHLDLVQGAIGFLAGNKDSLGNWGTTHATILTLRTMVMSLQNKTEEGEGTLTVLLNGVPEATLAITEENRNVFHQLELGGSAKLDAANEVTLEYVGTGRLMSQVVWSYWLPTDVMPPEASDVLDISVSWDKTQLAVSDLATCTATVTNLTAAKLSMVMVDLGVPPGFDVMTDKLDALVEAGVIMKYELPGQQVSIYLEELAPAEALALAFDVRARYPLEVTSAPSEAYLYYDTTTKDEAAGVPFEVQD